MLFPWVRIAPTLAAALLALNVSPARAELTEAELWLERLEPEMTRELSERIERDAATSFAPMVLRRLLAADAGDAGDAEGPPASPAQTEGSESLVTQASRSNMACAARTASSFACVVHPAR